MTLLFSHSGYSADPYDRETAIIGIMSRLMFSTNRIDTRIATEMIFNNFMKNIGKKGVFINTDSPQDAVQNMQQHRLDAVITNTLDYLEIDHMISPLHRYSVVIGPSKLQNIILLTRRSDKIENLSQLHRKRLTHPAGFNLGQIFLDVALMKQGLPVAERFFSNSDEVSDLNTAIIDLFFNKTDAALVTDASFGIASELNSQIHHQLEILIISEPIVPLVIGVNKFVPPEFTNRIDKMMSQLDQYPRTIHLLSLFKAKGIERISDQDLLSARMIKQEYNALLSVANGE
ncbi:MAG: PhnD/SsuA/transferrin family substrate-binding protein [Candidatus Thiodiazotropha sp.]